MNVIELVLTIVSIVLAQICLFYLYDKRADARTQQAINDVATDIGENIKATFADPNVKRAFSILGQHSGVSRAEEAVMNKFNNNLPELIPSLGIIGEKLGMEPVEMLQLINDPFAGPIIQRFLGGMGQGSNTPGRKGVLGEISG